MSLPLSIVVSSYARMACIQRLIGSAMDHFPVGSYEIIAVCSDHPASAKAQFLQAHSAQYGVVKYVQADVRLNHRMKSLYAYENMGLRLSEGEWVFVTNDDTTFDPNFYSSFAAAKDHWDVIITSGHLGDVGLGCRKAVIGTITPPNGATAQLYLYDFSLIRKAVYERLGYLDEGLDWFGKGFDLAMACETTPGLRICYNADIKVNHSIEAENRCPPDYHRDFRYAADKWTKWCSEHGWRFTWPW